MYRLCIALIGHSLREIPAVYNFGVLQFQNGNINHLAAIVIHPSNIAPLCSKDVRSSAPKTLPGDGSSKPLLDSVPQAGLLEPALDQDTWHGREWSRSSQGDDDPLPLDPPIVLDSDDNTTDGSSVDSDFTSPAKRDSSGRATSISCSPKAGGRVEAGTGIAGGRSTPLKRRPWASVMHPMIAVEVPVVADRLEEDISSSMQYENGLGSRQDRKLPGEIVQCVEDDTTMSDTSSSSGHSDDMDDDYRASSEEDGPTKPPPKRRRLSGAVARRLPSQTQRAAAAGRDVERVDSRVRKTAPKDSSTTPRNTGHGPDTHSHSWPPSDVERPSCPIPLLAPGEALMLSSAVAQVVFEMVRGCSMTTSDLAGEPTAAADTKNGERTVDLNRKRCRWTGGEDDRLMALKKDGFSWPEIGERFPQRRLSSLRQRWYTKL
ncbi:predicted protein [Histoplasma mississippiense (nom. inval.)]|uniref:predicted protein n=1 Tax=Ajellomyces capsulatus (strain NAm1 / WU24) TaxID=2059318 RepID=UPI000157BF4A|nr:predicted protein [Histoplasma mississippiense (nom. inval.)]EDN06495.1 predicted protein [Histoplasma mississippiense (nom. inval.)]